MSCSGMNYRHASVIELPGGYYSAAYSNQTGVVKQLMTEFIAEDLVCAQDIIKNIALVLGLCFCPCVHKITTSVLTVYQFDAKNWCLATLTSEAIIAKNTLEVNVLDGTKEDAIRFGTCLAVATGMKFLPEVGMALFMLNQSQQHKVDH